MGKNKNCPPSKLFLFTSGLKTIEKKIMEEKQEEEERREAEKKWSYTAFVKKYGKNILSRTYIYKKQTDKNKNKNENKKHTATTDKQNKEKKKQAKEQMNKACRYNQQITKKRSFSKQKRSYQSHKLDWGNQYWTDNGM